MSIPEHVAKNKALHQRFKRRSGQARPVRQRRARFRAQAQKVKICTQLLFTCGKNRQTSQDVSSIGCCPMPHLSNIQDSHIGSTHQVLTPRCFVDVPHVEYQKDARRVNVEPTDAQANWQHALWNIFLQFHKTWGTSVRESW